MIRIFTDTSANLPAALTKSLGVTVVPFSFTIEGRPYPPADRPDAQFDGPKFYSLMRRGAQVRTSMVNMQTYTDAFETALAAGDDVLYVGMSGGISGSCRAAELAAAELRERFPKRRLAVVDTKAASLGEGLPVLYAARMNEAGHPFFELVRLVRENAAAMCQFFTVEDLQYLKKGGRLSGAAALVGNFLQLKPILRGNLDGEIVQCRVERGREKSLEALAAKYTELVTDLAADVGIAHGDCPQDAAALEAKLRARGFTGGLLTVCYEPVTGSHVGPGTVALFFYGLRS